MTKSVCSRSGTNKIVLLCCMCARAVFRVVCTDVSLVRYIIVSCMSTAL